MKKLWSFSLLTFLEYWLKGWREKPMCMLIGREHSVSYLSIFKAFFPLYLDVCPSLFCQVVTFLWEILNLLVIFFPTKVKKRWQMSLQRSRMGTQVWKRDTLFLSLVLSILQVIYGKDYIPYKIYHIFWQVLFMFLTSSVDLKPYYLVTRQDSEIS